MFISAILLWSFSIKLESLPFISFSSLVFSTIKSNASCFDSTENLEGILTAASLDCNITSFFSFKLSNTSVFVSVFKSLSICKTWLLKIASELSGLSLAAILLDKSLILAPDWFLTFPVTPKASEDIKPVPPASKSCSDLISPPLKLACIVSCKTSVIDSIELFCVLATVPFASFFKKFLY